MSFEIEDFIATDAETQRKVARSELARVIAETIALQKVQNNRELTQEFIPRTKSFPTTARTRDFTAGEGTVLLIYVGIPAGWTGFLSGVGLGPFSDPPNTFFEILVDDDPIDGYSEDQGTDRGKVVRQLGSFTVPEPFRPPYVFKDHLKIFAGDKRTSGTTWTAGVTVQGVMVENPKNIALNSLTFKPEDLRRIVRAK